MRTIGIGLSVKQTTLRSLHGEKIPNLFLGLEFAQVHLTRFIVAKTRLFFLFFHRRTTFTWRGILPEAMRKISRLCGVSAGGPLNLAAISGRAAR